jgi:hypothetical protein
LGQLTSRIRYRCPCGNGGVVLTTTSFGTGGARKLHTQLVSCPVCKGHYTFSLTQSAEGAAVAWAKDLRTNDQQVLVEWLESLA